MEAIPHPLLAVEISPGRVAGARFTHGGSVDGFSVENLPPGAITPSAVETNLTNPAAVKSAVTNVCLRLGEEALPMLRWKLKKSVPFEVEETLLSYMRQAPRTDGVDVVTAIARLR